MVIWQNAEWILDEGELSSIQEEYTIEKARLDEDDWIAHILSEKTWADASLFVEAFYKARELLKVGDIDRTEKVVATNFKGFNPEMPLKPNTQSAFEKLMDETPFYIPADVDDERYERMIANLPTVELQLDKRSARMLLKRNEYSRLVE